MRLNSGVRGATFTGTLNPYLPRVLLRRLAEAPDELVQTHEGTLVFADISGFTRLSERLARTGREGAEHLVEAINGCFSALLSDAYKLGGSLLKFGGDAVLLWYEGPNHARRGCASAVSMRSTLASLGPIRTGNSEVTLRMSVGVHTGAFQMFLVGGSHREFVIAGPAASTVVAMEALAAAGQILISADVAAQLPTDCLGRRRGPGVLLARAHPVALEPAQDSFSAPSDEVVAQSLSTKLREHVIAAPAAAEHRTATVAFIQFGKLDQLLADEGADAAALALDEVVRVTQDAVDRYQVCLLGSDIAAGGGKLLLAGGAPRAVGDDEERTLLALREVVEAGTRLPVRLGINRGQVFAGDIGPPYRRTYALMGDTVNLAARLMSAAPWERIYGTESVLRHSQASFQTTDVPPLRLKGKLHPIPALDIGPVQRAAKPATVRRRLPLIGRDRELAMLRDAIAGAHAGSGTMIELVGETGSGKSRLLTETRALAEGMRFVHATCEAFTQQTPYVGWRDPLRQLLGLSWDDPGDVALAMLRERVQLTDPELLPWLPLLAIAIDADVPTTREVSELAPAASASKLREVVLRFLAPALKVPTLVEIEHAHLMDEASADLLHSLAGVLGDSAWLVIVTRRDADTGFVADPQVVTRMELEPLSREEARKLALATPEALEVPPHVLDLAVERSGGSPEALIDLLAAAAGGSGMLPESVDAATIARLDALGPGDRMLVRRAAVLGVSFHRKRLREVLESEDIDEHTWERLSTVFARDPDGHIRFKRPALREVAYAGLPFKLRRTLHASVAESLERDLGQDVDADPGVLSLHFILAGEHERAWRYARLGAERATERFAHGDAARLYRRAIEAGVADSATPIELAEAWEALAEALRLTGERPAAANALAAARRLVGENRLWQGRLFYAHAVIAQYGARIGAAVRWATRGLRELEGLELEEAALWRARLLAVLAYFRYRQDRLADAERLCRQAMAEAEASREMRALAMSCYVLDLTLVELGRIAEATHSPRALEIFRRLGDLERESVVLNNMGIIAYYRGLWDEAVERYRESGERSERAGLPGDAAYTEVNVGEILSDQGRYEEASAHLSRAMQLFRSTSVGHRVAFTQMLMGRLEVRRGHRDGLAQLQAAVEQLRALGLVGDVAMGDAYIAEAHVLTGDPNEGLTIAHALLLSGDRQLALLRRVQAIAWARLDEPEKCVELLRDSVEAAREAGADYELAMSLDLLGAMGRLDPAELTERDVLLARLGVTPPAWPVGQAAAAPPAVRQLRTR
jgi:class 3 adenylate cyclase